MARKPWDQLSPTYQRRLLSKGIGPQQHANPSTSLHQARGKVSPQHESYLRRVNTFVARYEKLYGSIGDVPDAPDFREAFKGLSTSDGDKAMRLQLRMEKYYDNGDFRKASDLWETRDPTLPEWMYYYHGHFS